MPAATKKSAPVPKGVIPASASFRLVEECEVDAIIFTAKQGRQSLYLQALQDLLAKPGRLMEVDSLTARGGISAQAKKHGITVLFGEQRGKLYVKVMGQDSPEELVLKALLDGPMNVIEIEAALVKAGSKAIAGDVVKTLSESNRIALRSVAGSNAKKWFYVTQG